MISPLRQWTEGETRFTIGSPLNIKHNSNFYSAEESINIHKPILKSISHYQLPTNYLSTNLPVVESSNKENVTDSSGPPNDGSSEELFRPRPKKNILSDSNNRQIIENAFSCFDDPYAKFPFPSTPKPPSPIGILLTPKTPASIVRERYIPNDVRTALQKAAVQGQLDFVHTLKKSGIKPEFHFASLSSKKKSNKKVNFDCSTPKAYSAVEDCETPAEKSVIIETPLSGFKHLENYLNQTENSPFSINLSGASSPVSSYLSDNSILEASSPDKDLPPEVKSTLLSGITCFVDCRSGNENRTDSVQAELISLGARVEKNFTKKVTHVVFKEGRMSTYIKAKKENIPLVGILWIEACKKVRGIADPSLYRPKMMQKYDRLLPFQMITKRRLAILNPNSRVRKNLMLLCGESSPASPEKKKRSRKAATEVKGSRKQGEAENGSRHCCNKKLFDNSDNGTKIETIVNKICAVDSSSSTDSSALVKELAHIRRKSAPGKLLSKKNAKKEDIKAYFKKIQAGQKKCNASPDDNVSLIEKEFQKLTTHKTYEDNNKGEQPLCTLENTQQTQERKKRKLFDPNESISMSQKSEVESDATSLGEPYISTPKRIRTKATCGPRLMKVSIARKLNANARKNEDMDTDSSPSWRWFINKPVSQGLKPKEPPSISFTSIPKSELSKYADIVKKLGKFSIDEKVTKTTTHLVSNGPRRTINLIKGIARGCWLIDAKWVLDSEASGRWLSHEDYDLSNAFPAAVECRKVRTSLKSTRVIDVFKGGGKIYVSRKLRGSPNFTDVEELLRICAANIVTSSAEADIIIGKKRSGSPAVCVSVKWVFDCITQNLLLPFHDFIEDEPLSQETQTNK